MVWSNTAVFDQGISNLDVCITCMYYMYVLLCGNSNQNTKHLKYLIQEMYSKHVQKERVKYSCTVGTYDWYMDILHRPYRVCLVPDPRGERAYRVQ